MGAALTAAEGEALVGLAVAAIAARLAGHALAASVPAVSGAGFPRDGRSAPDQAAPGTAPALPRVGTPRDRPAVGDRAAATAPESPALRAPGASFVTLEAGGRLRGCIGSLEPIRPLYQDVIRNAVRAMTDPRLPPVTADEWPRLTVSVSVLSPAEPVRCATRDALLAALRPGVDGLILARGRRRATFLPKVWQKLATPERFVAALLAKGGWPPDPWPPGLAASRYTVAEFRARCCAF